MKSGAVQLHNKLSREVERTVSLQLFIGDSLKHRFSRDTCLTNKALFSSKKQGQPSIE